jgi:hypothetical protein
MRRVSLGLVAVIAATVCLGVLESAQASTPTVKPPVGHYGTGDSKRSEHGRVASLDVLPDGNVVANPDCGFHATAFLGEEIPLSNGRFAFSGRLIQVQFRDEAHFPTRRETVKISGRYIHHAFVGRFTIGHTACHDSVYVARYHGK